MERMTIAVATRFSSTGPFFRSDISRPRHLNKCDRRRPQRLTTICDECDSLRLYAWAKKYVSNGKNRISLEDLRKVLGLESVKDAEGNVIQKAPLPIWANFRQRALDVAILEINKKTDLKIEIQSLERWKHRRVTAVIFVIQEQAVPKKGD
jgi:hypothetical protein